MLIVGLLEIIGELARIVSFTFRLFGNIFAGEMLLIIMAFLLPVIGLIPFLGPGAIRGIHAGHRFLGPNPRVRVYGGRRSPTASTTKYQATNRNKNLEKEFRMIEGDIKTLAAAIAMGVGGYWARTGNRNAGRQGDGGPRSESRGRGRHPRQHDSRNRVSRKRSLSTRSSSRPC